ncbi:MAG: CotH kinase family protein [Bacteroidales bacterium]|nr:CotH kinase family protein [Bacteroidales bacterium]
MDRKFTIWPVLILFLLMGCGDQIEEQKQDTTPSEAHLTMITESVSLITGGEGYVDFRISPYGTTFNYDVPGNKSDISLSKVSGVAADFPFKISRIEPLGEGTYRVFLKDASIKFTYNELLCLSFKDALGRFTRSNGFRVACSCDETTQKLIDTGLPLVIIVTDNGEEPTCEYVSHPPGCNGAGIKNATKVPGSVTILEKGNIKYTSGDYKEKESGMTVRIRGNTSAYGAKKPYKIKLQKKADLLSRDDGKDHRDKDWLLLRYDGLKTMAGFKVNDLLGLQWTPGFQFVNVLFNGDYRGLYMLTESVKRNDTARLNVSKEGYVIEYDAYWWNEDFFFTNGWNYSMAYTFKYPEEDEVTPEQVTYIKNYIKKVEDGVRNGTYDSYIDVTSFARWLLAHDILGNLDVAGSNIYMTKFDNSDGSLLKMANLWDFDNIYRMEGNWSNAHLWGAGYFPQLLASKNPAFRQAYVSLWNTHSNSVFKATSNLLKNFASSETGKAVDASIVLDNKRWKSSQCTVEESYETAKGWFETRPSYLSSAIAGLR